MNLSMAAILAVCERRVRDGQVDFACSYGEPGYTDPKSGILFANWNDSPRWLQNWLESHGYEMEWSDEWIILHESNSKAYRTSPDCYGWTPYYVMADDCTVFGGDEIESGDQVEWYIDEYLLNNTRRANVFRGLKLGEHGFEKHNGEFETGFHPGQNDSPDVVFKKLRESHPNHDVVFQIDLVGQFDSHWSAWIRPRVDSE